MVSGQDTVSFKGRTSLFLVFSNILSDLSVWATRLQHRQTLSAYFGYAYTNGIISFVFLWYIICQMTDMLS